MFTVIAIASVALLQAGGSPDSSRATRAPDSSARPADATAAQLATAFRDARARVLLDRARDAHSRQDSSILSYDAMAYERLTASASIHRTGRDRQLLRKEQAARVRWHRDAGAHVELMAARFVHPGNAHLATQAIEASELTQAPVLPFLPSEDPLWIVNGLELVDGRLIHPVARGAEAHYTYESGDSVTLRLPDGAEVRLLELRVRPRSVRWDRVVGSLWVDAERGTLVRAAYRLSEPLEIWSHVGADPSDDEVPGYVRALMQPMRAHVTAMIVDYGLFEGRFWLPRLQVMEGHAELAFVRARFTMEQSYRYSAINSVPADSLRPTLDSSARTTCDSSAVHTSIARRTTARIPVAVAVPCDTEALARSAELPSTVEASGVDLFARLERDELAAQSLGMSAQAAWEPVHPTVELGLHLTRFNRIEGLSTGVRVAQQLGAGLVADGTLRLGAADRVPNLELGVAITNLERTLRLGGYERLVAANDWGNPLSFGSSLSALFFGRDEGFYYRARGVELTSSRDAGEGLTWRLFAEHQRSAPVESSFSFAKLVNDVAFTPNITATPGLFAGAALRAAHSVGTDPRAWRGLTDLRLEAAGGDGAAYGRGAVDLTLSRAVGPTAGNGPLAAMTLSLGSSIGDLPPQRHWYLGGSRTIRGHRPGAASGEAYWLGRLELAQQLFAGTRLSLFGDAGWAGDRSALGTREPFRLRTSAGTPAPLSGAGIGLSVLDGLLRIDVAKGLQPGRAWRTDLYLDARF